LATKPITSIEVDNIRVKRAIKLNINKLSQILWDQIEIYTCLTVKPLLIGFNDINFPEFVRVCNT